MFNMKTNDLFRVTFEDEEAECNKGGLEQPLGFTFIFALFKGQHENNENNN